METTPTAHTFIIACPCCGMAVEARCAGFSATTVEVVACPTRQATGIVSVTMRKSAAYAAAEVEPIIHHRGGLVTFA